jgi:nitrous oxide reductase accessory protein NosL
MHKLLGLFALLLLLAGCSGEPDTGPGKVRWDREICARCAMAVSDHNYAAQIRGGPVGQKGKLYKFDDIGCAVIWLDQQPWKDNPSIEIWVTDYRNGDWIDARKAWYVKGKITPMGYGLGATPEKETGALDFAAAKKHIYNVEETFHIHRGDSGDIHAPTGETP